MEAMVAGDTVVRKKHDCLVALQIRFQIAARAIHDSTAKMFCGTIGPCA
jgi:hypothetical protein